MTVEKFPIRYVLGAASGNVARESIIVVYEVDGRAENLVFGTDVMTLSKVTFTDEPIGHVTFRVEGKKARSEVVPRIRTV